MGDTGPVSEPTTLSRPSREKADTVGAAATDLALAAAQEAAGDPSLVGGWTGVQAAGERVVVHRFSTTHPGYPGWSWCVALSRVSRAKVPTVDEVWLEPDGDAVLAPEWKPWSERVRPGDLSPGDLYPTSADDIRLAPGFSGADDLDGETADLPLSPVGWELGLGRVRVLSASGRGDAADRWADGDGGPDTPLAKAAPARCSSCGWLLTIGGPLGQGFGLCANEMSPSDGRAVTLDHGCGAHSEVDAEPVAALALDTVLDEVGFEAVEMTALRPVESDEGAADVEMDAAALVDDVDADVVLSEDDQVVGDVDTSEDGDVVAQSEDVGVDAVDAAR
jgi:hypothetical protein